MRRKLNENLLFKMEKKEFEDFQPRPYQIDLYLKALQKNSIIYLPTGTGKTFIAVLLIKHMSGVLQQPFNESGKVTIFIVNTVALVHQQTAFVSRHTGLVCKGYCGDMKVDFWTGSQWNNEFQENQVLIMTAQIFLNLLVHGIMSLKKVNLIIFDECHRAVKDHPMRLIMQRFEDYEEKDHPRVLAMSGSLLNSNIKIHDLSETLKELETTFLSKIITVESLNIVAQHATKPQEYLKFYGPPKEFGILRIIQNIHDNAIKVLSIISIPNKVNNPDSSKEFQTVERNVKLKRILSDIKEHLEELGLYGGAKGVLLHIIQLEYIKKFCDEQHFINILDYTITQLIKIQKLLHHEMDEGLGYKSDELIYKYSSPKIKELVQILKTSFENKKPDQKFCCIVFVQRRFSAQILFHILKDLSVHDSSLYFLKPEFMVGYNNDPYKNARELICLSESNREAITKFRNGKVNCLIATDVVDEGVDIPSCSLIIRFYAPRDFRAYVQSKGRARHADSKFVILAADNDDYKSRYQNFKRIEEQLQFSLHGKTDSRLHPSEDEVSKSLYVYTIEPFIINKNDGNQCIVTEQMAISLINEYCSILIQSKFITLTPTWVKEEVTINHSIAYKVKLTLPPISPLKETIIGDPYESLDIAKRSAAVKAVIALYKLGELDDNLKPKKIECALEDAKYLFPHLTNEEPVDKGIPGTYSKKRRHLLVHPESLYAAFPQDNQTLYLHIIDMKPTYSKPISDNRHLAFYNLLSSRNTYGILSTKKLYNIPSFPIYMNVGVVQVDININNHVKPLTKSEIECLTVFHSLIFNHILDKIKNFMIFDVHNKENSFLVVPVNENCQINWDVVHQYKVILNIPPKKPIEVKVKDYDLALVTPSYRDSSVYIVTQICEYLKAESRFPTPDFDSYVHYFKDKHELIIEDTKQPMLEVKPISKRINSIKPRNIKAGLSKRKRASLTEDFEEHLVPELCLKIDFPSVYWLKATTLPSILYRITGLLLAEDLRVKIAKEACLDLTPIAQEHKWDPLQMKIETLPDYEKDDEPEDQHDESILEDDEDFMDSTVQENVVEVDVLSLEKDSHSWTKDEEPQDLYRQADQIQLVDIEYYYQFMSKVTSTDEEYLKHKNIIKCNYQAVSNEPVPILNMLEKINKHGPSPTDILQAITSKISSDGFNFEIVETLGDSFLKFAISLYLFQTFPNFEEGKLTHLKGKLVGNLNLFCCAKNKSIAGRIIVEKFAPMYNFIVPAYVADRNLQKIMLDSEVSPSILHELSIPASNKTQGTFPDNLMKSFKEKISNWPKDPLTTTGMERFLGIQIVSDKTVSDCVEAIIGTYLSNLGVKGALKILKWFEILPNYLNIEDFLHAEVTDPKIGIGNVDDYIPVYKNIEKNLGYQFRNRAYLLQALTHPSFTTNRITSSYQRLEFLGDAILDFLLTVYIYENCGNLSPGELTDLRSALVNNITFACLAVRHGLHTAILAYAPTLFNLIDKFVKFQQDRNHEINDELLWVLLEEDDCNMAEHIDVPKLLGDVYESIIGAIFLDSGKCLRTVWSVIYRVMKKEIELFSKKVPKQPIRVIHETQGANPKFSKGIIVENTTTVMISLTINDNGNRKYFHGFGTTKKLAKCAAAKQALKYLRYK